MENGKQSVLMGILGVIGCVVLVFVLKKIFPSLFGVVVWILGIAAALVVLLVAVILFFALRKPKKTPEQEQADAQEAALKKARSTLMELRTGAMRIRDPQICGSAGRICVTLDRLLKLLKEQPEDFSKARSFLNHSMPLLNEIVKKYVRLEQNGKPTEEVTAQTAACLRDLEAAAEKQCDNLFANDIVDITAEMEALTQFCRQNGLLEDPLVLELPKTEQNRTEL